MIRRGLPLSNKAKQTDENEAILNTLINAYENLEEKLTQINDKNKEVNTELSQNIKLGETPNGK